MSFFDTIEHGIEGGFKTVKNDLGGFFKRFSNSRGFQSLKSNVGDILSQKISIQPKELVLSPKERQRQEFQKISDLALGFIGPEGSLSERAKPIEEEVIGEIKKLFKPKNVELSKTLQERQALLDIRKEQLSLHPARGLEKYTNKRTGELPEVLGSTKKGGIFRTRGDQMTTERGFADSEEARQSFQKYIEEKQSIQEEEKSLKQDINSHILEQKKINKDQESLNKFLNKQPIRKSREFSFGQHVDESPLEFSIDENAKITSRNIREAYSGAKNSQIFRGNQVFEEVKKLLPTELEREALTLYRDVGGDTSLLEKALKEEKFKPYETQIRAAMNLSEAGHKANQILEKYFSETGQAGQKYNFINELRDNYINRIYKPEPPGKFVQTEVSRSGLTKTTSHGKERVFDTLLDAIRAGKKPATLDAYNLGIIHSKEFSKVLTNNKLLDSLRASGLGEDLATEAKGKVPRGYQRVGNSNFIVPDWLHTGIKAITEPNFIAKIDKLRHLNQYQGLVKTIDLSFSLFHHFTMAMQLLYQTKFGLELPNLIKTMKNNDFRVIATDFLQHNGMLHHIDTNRDVIRKLSEGDDVLSQIWKIPGFKQIGNAIEKNSEFLFGKIQSWLKVSDYGKNISSWIDKHPNATNEEIKLAKRGFADQINAAYGGLNWEALGTTPSMQAVSRLLLLAPDWTFSNYYLAKYALSGGVAGAKARSHIISALIGGVAITEGLNKMITGHYTDKNSKGHAFEVEIRPNVYISFFRGGIGDILKLTNNISEKGPGGTAAFLQGKLSPLTRTAVGLASNTQYASGPKIYDANKSFLENTLSFGKYIASSAGPVPFGVTASTGGGQQDITGHVLTATGLARPGYAKDPLTQAISEKTQERKKDEKKIMPIYKQIQELIKQGNTDEAQSIFDNLTEQEHQVYEAIKKSEKSKTTREEEKQFYPTFQKIQQLKNSGNVEEAQSLFDSLTEEEHRIYDKLKKRI